MITVNADEVLREIEKRRNFDKIKLEEINWVTDKGESIPIDKETLDRGRFYRTVE